MQMFCDERVKEQWEAIDGEGYLNNQIKIAQIVVGAGGSVCTVDLLSFNGGPIV